MYCRKCGTELSDSAKFCSKCGFKMRDKEEHESPKEETPIVEKVETGPQTEVIEIQQYFESDENLQEMDEYLFFKDLKNRETVYFCLNILNKIIMLIGGCKVLSYIFLEEHSAEITTVSSAIIGFLIATSLYIAVFSVSDGVVKLFKYKESHLQDKNKKDSLLKAEIIGTIAEVVAIAPFFNPSELVMAKWGMTILMGSPVRLLMHFPLSIACFVIACIVQVHMQKNLLSKKGKDEID